MKTKDAFTDRRKEAEAAKARLLEKFKARPAANDPAVMERLAAKEKAAAENAARLAAREQEKKLAREQAAEEEKRASAEAERLAAEKAIADEAAKKAQRDARYAARKSRQ